MKKLTKLLSAVTALAVVSAAGLTATANVSADEASAPSYSVKEYTPDQYDTVDFYSGAGDINPEDGDGITTFAHIGLVTPLNGSDIEFDTSFTLLSKKAVEEGGHGIDGWLTYSFAKAPANAAQDDSTVPSYANGTDGVFLHITNYSGNTAPNCVEMQIVQRLNGATTTISNSFVDNIVGVRMTFSLAQVGDTYTLTLYQMDTEVVIKEIAGLALNPEAFVNEYGQTYFGTAIYEDAGCDGNHWEHRGLSIYSVNAYNADIDADSVVLSQSEYTYEDGVACTPEVTVTVDGVELENGVDYEVVYENNNAVGTATAKVVFYGERGGNVVEKEFAINEAEVEVPENPENPGNTDTPDTPADGAETEDGGCGSVIAISSIAAVLLPLGAVLVAKKRN